MVSKRIFKDIDSVEPAHSARRAGQQTKMEESASHHVNDNEMCFLVRLRRQNCNFEAPGPSPVDFFGFQTCFRKLRFSSFFGRRKQSTEPGFAQMKRNLDVLLEDMFL